MSHVVCWDWTGLRENSWFQNFNIAGHQGHKSPELESHRSSHRFRASGTNIHRVSSAIASYGVYPFHALAGTEFPSCCWIGLEQPYLHVHCCMPAHTVWEIVSGPVN